MSGDPEDAEFRPARPAKTRPALRAALAWSVLLAYLALIEALIGWAALVAPWRALNPGQLAIAACLFSMSYAIRAHRLYDYLGDAARGRWLLALRLMILHNALNNLMPMRSGELSFPLLAKRYFGLGFGRSVPVLLWFRLLDLHTVLLIACAVLVSEISSWQVAALVITPLAAAPAAAYAGRDALRRRIRTWRKRRLSALGLKALDGLPEDWMHFARSWGLTWANWLLKLLVLAWVLAQFVDASFIAAAMGAIGGELTSVLPFHAPGGVGTYEAGIVAGIAPFGVGMRASIEAAVNAHLFVLGAALVGATLALLVPRRTPRRFAE